jgi:membrane fusion protein, multidrug efflux system
MRRTAGLALGLLLVGCGADEQVASITATPVEVTRVDSHRVEEQIQATGQLLAVDEAHVAAEVSGQVTSVVVREGTPVAAGEVVLEIDRERRELELANETAMVEGARERIENEKRELDRVRRLHKSQAASQSQLDAAGTRMRSEQSALAGAEAQRGLAERALRDSSVSAPFAGIVARRFVSVGDHVSIGEPLFDLVALDPVEVEFFLSERDSSRVELGDHVEVHVAPFPDETFQATVHVISPRIDPQTRTLRVKALLANSDGRLRPGLFARADLGVAVREGVPMIPENAVLQRSDGSVAFVLDDSGRAQRRNVELGVIRDGLAEVIKGVSVGERVVVRGMSRLVDGSAVDVREADGSKPPPAAVAGSPEAARATP